MIDFGLDAYEPWEWVSRHGKPAACTSEWGWHGLPSYEHVDGKTVVYDFMVAQVDADGQVRLFSTWYATACIVSPEGPVPLHHNPEARWEWRPCLYRLHAFNGLTMLSSQDELRWRAMLAQWMHHVHAGADWTIAEAEARADRLLEENLSPQQWLEWKAWRKFRVRGHSGSLYRIRSGDGFELISPWTGKSWVSFCLHPEEYLPASDVALAVKLALEDEELEAQVKGNARTTFLSIGRGATEDERVAARLEKELIA